LSISPIFRSPHQRWSSRRWPGASSISRHDPPVEGPVAAAHERPEQRQILDRVEEGVPLDELPLLPEQAVELGRVERPEPAPEDEVLRRGHRRDRVELEEAEPAHGVEDLPSPAVEALRADGDPPRLFRRDLEPLHERESTCGVQAPESIASRRAASSPPQPLDFDG
jgi:hypothetical protein